MTGTGNELAPLTGAVVRTPGDRALEASAASPLHSWLVVMSDVITLANYIHDTSFVPKAYRGDPHAVAAAILAGMELDLPPMTALRHVQVVEGSPGLSAEYKRARVLAAGHRLDIEERTTETCTVTGHRQGHKSVTVTYTIGDARRAGLVKDRGAYVTRPRRMLFARACTEVCDALFSDLTNGLPTAELLEAEAGGVNGYDDQAARTDRPRVSAEQARARNPQTVAAVAETVTPDASPAAPEAPGSGAAVPPSAEAAAGEAPVTEATRVEIDQRLGALGVEAKNRVRVASQIAGKPMKDATEADGRKVADTLEGIDPAGLDGLLADRLMETDPRKEPGDGE